MCRSASCCHAFCRCPLGHSTLFRCIIRRRALRRWILGCSALFRCILGCSTLSCHALGRSTLSFHALGRSSLSLYALYRCTMVCCALGFHARGRNTLFCNTLRRSTLCYSALCYSTLCYIALLCPILALILRGLFNICTILGKFPAGDRLAVFAAIPIACPIQIPLDILRHPCRIAQSLYYCLLVLRPRIVKVIPVVLQSLLSLLFGYILQQTL